MNDPYKTQQQGMLNLPLALGIGILSSQRPTPYKQSFFNSIGPGLARGVQMYASGRGKPQSELERLRVQQLRAQMEEKKRNRETMASAYEALAGDPEMQPLLDMARGGSKEAQRMVIERMYAPDKPKKPPSFDEEILANGMVQRRRWNAVDGVYEPVGDPYPRWKPSSPGAVVHNYPPQNMPPPIVDPELGTLVWDPSKGRYVRFMETQQATAPGTDVGKSTMNKAEAGAGKTGTQAATMTGLLKEAGKYQELFTYEGKIKQKVLRVRAKLKGTIADALKWVGADPTLSAEEQEWLSGTRRVVEAVEYTFNGYRSEITGAAASVQELDRLQEAMMNMNLSWPEFKASAETAARRMQLAMEVKQRMYGSRNLKMLNKAQWKALDDAIQDVWHGGGNGGGGNSGPTTPPPGGALPMAPDPLETGAARQQGLEQLRKQGMVGKW